MVDRITFIAYIYIGCMYFIMFGFTIIAGKAQVANELINDIDNNHIMINTIPVAILGFMIIMVVRFKKKLW